MERLYDKLLKYSRENYYPMHMPGHKRNTKLFSMVNPYEIDITEIEGFDNLHQAEGILRDLSLRLKALYGAESTYPLVNGSTAGILAGISALTDRGDQVLLARNCHKSVYHGTALRELRPIYLYPERIGNLPICGGILPEKIEELLINHPETKLVVITSPTYEGVVSDIKAISEVVHRYGAFLLVDEAHVAHFGFHDKFPKSAVTMGADIVIQSLHKTLPAFTQTAVLHSNRKELNHKIEHFLGIYQSSSPSYLLMAGMDQCVSILEEQSKTLFHNFYDRLDGFYRAMEALKQLKLINREVVGGGGVYDLDPSKLTILVRHPGLTGKELSVRLREQYHIAMELEAMEYVLGMTSICDTDEGFHRLEEALLQIDQELDIDDMAGRIISTNEYGQTIYHPEQVIDPFNALEQDTETVILKDSVNRIVASYISIYPPGIPLLVPGERMNEELLHSILEANRVGLNITGLTGTGKEMIEVIING